MTSPDVSNLQGGGDLSWDPGEARAGAVRSSEHRAVIWNEDQEMRAEAKAERAVMR